MRMYCAALLAVWDRSSWLFRTTRSLAIVRSHGPAGMLAGSGQSCPWLSIKRLLEYRCKLLTSIANQAVRGTAGPRRRSTMDAAAFDHLGYVAIAALGCRCGNFVRGSLAGIRATQLWLARRCHYRYLAHGPVHPAF